MILQISANGACEYASPAIRDMLGWAPEDLVGRRWAHLIDRRYRADVLRMRALLYDGEDRATGTVRCRRRSGAAV